MTSRTGVFAMADGIVTVEGIWVRYGTNYTIKYVHVVNPTVSVGNTATAGQRLGIILFRG